MSMTRMATRRIPLFRVVSGVVAAAMSLAILPVTAQETANRLTDAERAAGWELLFDGNSLEKWRGYRQDRTPGSWQAVDGILRFVPGEGRGDIITREQFEDFELALEWRISPGGNSGILFRASEDEERIWETAPEYQVLDNSRHPDGRNPMTSAGSNYALHAPTVDATRPVGEWNEVRLVVVGSHVEHWLNGVRVVEYELWTDEWRALVADTKFGPLAKYGVNRRGHIGLQDHDNVIDYRNIRIRRVVGG